MISRKSSIPEPNRTTSHVDVNVPLISRSYKNGLYLAVFLFVIAEENYVLNINSQADDFLVWMKNLDLQHGKPVLYHLCHCFRFPKISRSEVRFVDAELYILVISKVKSGRAPTCGNAYS